MTVRKALVAMEEKKIFRKAGRSRLFNDLSGKSGREIRVAYLTTGEVIPALPTYQRLEKELQIAMEETGVAFSNICWSWHRKDEDWPPEEFRTVPDIVIYAGPPEGRLYHSVRTLRHQCLLIGIDEECAGRLDCVVSLNNYQAGYLAAEKLIKSGSRNPAIIVDGRPYRPFLQRTAGFMDALSDNGLSIESCFYDKGSALVDWKLPELLDRVIQSGHDGLFLFTDHNIVAVHEYINKLKPIPSEFRLITLATEGAGRQSYEPVSAVSHALPEIAQRITEIAVAMSRGEAFEKINLIDAEFILGTTLQGRKKR
eukprot:TRINITY_DN9411_c0_g1_i2.p1 TRINITY_DN9411_c0_g1~~TRINITY_DN9411_c0_g1_i2.p1  ORF type:complete len:312 (+),score=19.03 TRINITY_DN9411_c0_g1_i2:2-937(+)